MIKVGKNPLITIGIASYNYDKYLKKAFDIIKKQKFKNFEVLYVDDGSTDNSINVIEQIIEENPEMMIRLISGKNIGVQGNKNRIIDNARGKYILFCDADDYLTEHGLDELACLALKTDADEVIGEIVNVDKYGKILQIQKIGRKPSKWTKTVLHASIYKKAILDKNNIRFNPNFFPDDLYINMFFHNKSKKTEFINRPVYNWCMHSDSAGARQNGQDRWHGFLKLKDVLKCIKRIYDENSGVDKKEIEYTAIKEYGGCVLNRSSSTPFKDYYNEYRKMNALMGKVFPDYKKNNYAKTILGRGIVRDKAAFIIFMLLVIEKLKMMKVFLWGYWLITKKINVVE